MTHTNQPFFILAVAALGVALASCSPQEKFSGQPEVGAADADGPRVVQATPRVALADESDIDRRSLASNPLSQRLVFFDYDKSLVRALDRPVLDAHSDFLVDNRGLRVLLQGHADERGSTEYNLALGQRRADAVREYLVAGGVFSSEASNDQIEAVSYGEERPRSLGNTESAWAENRRVEIVYDDE